jgi:molecular chaperone DnaK (HSP70)
LIQRNSPLPAAASKIFRTSRAEQTRVVVEVVQSRGDARAALSLGHFAFGPIAAPQKNYPIEVAMHYDHEGIVEVFAKDPRTGQQVMHKLSHDDQQVGRTGEGGTSEGETGDDAERDLVASVQVND